jgi:Domain of unknown function (DUF4190)
MGQPPQPVTTLPPPPSGGTSGAGGTAARPTNSLAVVSLVAGVAGYVIPHPFLAGIIAIITGHMARKQIRQTGEGGGTFALIGLILGYVHFALSILLVGLLVLLLFGVGLFAVSHSR